MFDSILTYVAGALLLTNVYTGASSWIKSNDINELKSVIKIMEAEAMLHKINEEALISAIDKQNEKIKTLSVDLNASLGRCNNRTPSTVYVDRCLTKYVDRNETVEIDEKECKNAKYIFDAIRDSNF